MTKPFLIIISGLPATGKTTLSQHIAEQLHIPLISKDTIKEILFDTIGHGDRAWGEKLNLPTYQLVNYFVGQELTAGRSLILETPYDEHFPRDIYAEWQERYGFESVQIMCHADPQILIARFIARIGAPGRHPGHNDHDALEDFKQSIMQQGKAVPLPLNGEVYELDTSDFNAVDTEALLQRLRRLL